MSTEDDDKTTDGTEDPLEALFRSMQAAPKLQEGHAEQPALSGWLAELALSQGNVRWPHVPML
jgi:hypothetical protein